MYFKDLLTRTGKYLCDCSRNTNCGAFADIVLYCIYLINCGNNLSLGRITTVQDRAPFPPEGLLNSGPSCAINRLWRREFRNKSLGYTCGTHQLHENNRQPGMDRCSQWAGDRTLLRGTVSCYNSALSRYSVVDRDQTD